MDDFPDTFLDALGAWQRGWREDQDVRIKCGDALRSASANLPTAFKSVSVECYRKRFLRASEYPLLFLNEFLEDGLTSWTIDRAFAEKFKGIRQPDTDRAAIFSCRPHPDDVVLNIPALWDSTQFREAVERYERAGGRQADSLLNFKGSQGEVLLDSQMLLSDLVALAGEGSTFEQLCERWRVPELAKDDVWKLLVEAGTAPGERRFLKSKNVQAAVQRVREQLCSILKAKGIDPNGPGS